MKSIPFLRDTRHELYDTYEKERFAGDIESNQTLNYTQNFMEEESAFFLEKA